MSPSQDFTEAKLYKLIVHGLSSSGTPLSKFLRLHRWYDPRIIHHDVAPLIKTQFACDLTTTEAYWFLQAVKQDNECIYRYMRDVVVKQFDPRPGYYKTLDLWTLPIVTSSVFIMEDWLTMLTKKATPERGKDKVQPEEATRDLLSRLHKFKGDFRQRIEGWQFVGKNYTPVIAVINKFIRQVEGEELNK